MRHLMKKKYLMIGQKSILLNLKIIFKR